jgi:hypothetical protein
MRGLPAALTATTLPDASSEYRGVRITSTKGKPDLETTAKTV